MHPPPTAGVIGLDGSDHQRAAGGSVGVENPENGENGENKNPAKSRRDLDENGLDLTGSTKYR